MTNDGRFNGYVESVTLHGDAVITVGDEGLFAEHAGKSLDLTYADIESFQVQNFRLTINAETFTAVFSQMGRDVDVLYEQLWKAFNRRTLQAFFVQELPIFEAEGEFRYHDEGGQASGTAKIMLFKKCLCILPPNDKGRRIPICFMAEPELVNFTIKMTLDTGEDYEVMRLGDRTKRLFELLNQNLMEIHSKAIASAKAVDMSLEAQQASDIAWLLPDGAAASIAALNTIAPSYTNAVEAKIAASRAAETYVYFKEYCTLDTVCFGAKSGLSWIDTEAEILWVTALRKKSDGGVAAVELALGEEDAAATYVYRFKGDLAAFFKRLNHAMEAIDFHREVIAMTDGELRQGANELYAMAVKRTAALRFLRASFADRAIHRSLESWKKSINDLMA